MNKKLKRITLTPAYFKKFSCIGQDCEDNCCHGWSIAIDRKTYKLYQNVRLMQTKELIRKHVRRNRSNPQEYNYAKISLNDRGYCPLQDENNLCIIHKSLGADALSKVCSSYPRVFNEVDGVIEQSLTMSCAEAVRIALLNKEPIEFDEMKEEISTNINISQRINCDVSESKSEILNKFWNLRIFSISLIQNRKYSLDERLVILGLFTKKLEEYIESKRIDDIDKLISTYNEYLVTDAFKESILNIPNNLVIQMELMKELNDVRIGLGINSEAYMKIIGEFLHGVSYTDGASIEEIAENYVRASDKYYKPFIASNEHIFENYLVNHMFMKLFPCSDEKLVFNQYIKLILHYSMIKMLLIGMSAFHKELKEDMIVRLIYSFTRVIDHNQTYIDSALELLEKHRFTSMAYMSILIKN